MVAPLRVLAPPVPDGASRRARAAEPAVPLDVPAPAASRADGVELLGELIGSGYRLAPGLVRRVDGQTVQLTPLLYQMLDAIDGSRTHDEIAHEVSERIDRLVTAEDVAFLIEAKLRPLGVLRERDGAEPVTRRANPLLALRLRYAVSNPAVTRRLTAPFAVLFRLPVVVAAVVAFLATCWWVLFEEGLAAATHQALYEPGVLLLVFGLTLLSSGFHEFGHAAACRSGGATPGTMGVGLYLLWPVFYTDVTDSYRLGRWGRLRVDVGGLYFNVVFALVVLGAWFATRWDALLLVIVAQVLQMVRQLAPLVRFDGYHILADLTGVPDLFAHIAPTLLGMLPTRWGRPEGKLLKPWARAVVTVWVLVVVPLLAVSVVVMAVVLPSLAATAWDSLGVQWADLEANLTEGDVLAAGVRVVSVVAIAVPVLSIAYLLVRVVRRTLRRVLHATAGHPVQRVAVGVGAALLAAALLWAWWPSGQYAPIEPTDRGTLPDAVPFVELLRKEDPASRRGGAVGDVDPSRGADATEAPRRPRLALVMIPASEPATTSADRSGVAVPARPGPTSAEPGAAQGGILPFPLPPEPGPGGNQALAVNTDDGSTLYEVALALTWVTDGEPVDQRNEAWALASCRDCTTTAVAFQVVVVVGRTEVATPTNQAVAVNYACVTCVTQALATQLVATVEALPDPAAMDELAGAWEQLEEVSENIERLPLEQVYAELLAVEDAILETLSTAVPTSHDSSEDSDASPPASSPTPTASPAPTDEPSSEPTMSATTSEEPSPSDEPSASAEPSPSDEPSASAEPSPSDEPSPSEEPSPSPEPSPSTTGDA